MLPWCLEKEKDDKKKKKAIALTVDGYVLASLTNEVTAVRSHAQSEPRPVAHVPVI